MYISLSSPRQGYILCCYLVTCLVWLRLCLHPQGGVGFFCDHRPFCAVRASASRPCRRWSWGAYFRYHQARPLLTSWCFRLVPSGSVISATLRPYRSLALGWTVTSFPNAASEVNFFAAAPKGWPFSGQSIPWESEDTLLISCNVAVSVLFSLSANCARSFSQCGPNAHDQPIYGPFS